MIGELAALGAAICWTVSAVLYKDALSETTPLSANIIRCAATSMVLIALLAVLDGIGSLATLPLQATALASVSGIIGLGFGDSLYLRSLKLVGVARAVPITCTYPLFSIILAVSLRNEVVTFQMVLGAVLIIAGIWLLSRDEEANMSKLRRADLVKGVASALATALLWSVSILFIDIAIALQETGSLEYASAINTIRILATAAFLLASAPITHRSFNSFRMRRRTLYAIILGGVIALAIGWFLLTISFLYIPESQAVPISSTSPLFATIVGIVFLNEPASSRTVAGSFIIVLGIFLIFVI